MPKRGVCYEKKTAVRAALRRDAGCARSRRRSPHPTWTATGAKKFIDYLAMMRASSIRVRHDRQVRAGRARSPVRSSCATSTARSTSRRPASPSPYSDVPSSAWYYETVRIAREVRLHQRRGQRQDGPGGARSRASRRRPSSAGCTRPTRAALNRHPASSSRTRRRLRAWSAGYVKAAVDKGIPRRLQATDTFQADTRGHHARRSWRRSSYLLPWHLAFDGRARPIRAADLRGDTDERHHFGKLHAVRCDDRGRSVPDGGSRPRTRLQLSDVYGQGHDHRMPGGTVTMTNTTSDHIVVSSPMGRLL